MAFTSLTAKSAGGTLTRAEVVDLLDNLGWFYTPPAFRVYSTATGSLTGTLTALDWSPSDSWHAEWREGGGGEADDTTFTDSTGGLWVNVGDVQQGVWICGAMIRTENDPVQTAKQIVTRRLQARRGDGTTFTELSEVTGAADTNQRRWAEQMTGLGTFNATTDRFEVRGQNLPSATFDVLGDRRWGVWVADTDDTYSINFVDARQISDTNSELLEWFNNMRSNQYRIQRRPSAQRYKTSNTAFTANTLTQVPLGETDWSTDPDMAPGSGSTSIIAIQQAGVYFVTGQVTYDLATGAARGEAIVARDATTIASTNTPDVLGASGLDTVAAVQDVEPFSIGEEVRLYGRATANCDVVSGRGTQLTATLVSSSDGVGSGRQVFARCPAPATWPDVADISSEHLPVGTMRALSDIQDRMWHRPVIKAQLSEEELEVEAGGGWTDIDCDDLVLDYTDLEGTHGYSLISGGALVLPWSGIWLVGARLLFSPTTVEGENKGNVGHRGMRIALGKNAAAGQVFTTAMHVSTQGWVRTISETVVTNRAEQEVRLQGVVATIDNDEAFPVLEAHIWAVELGDNITRTPR